MTRCEICGRFSHLISKSIGVCHECIKKGEKRTVSLIKKAHEKTRTQFNLPDKPPKAPEGVLCGVCMNECKIPDGSYGYCGIRKNINQRLTGPTKELANLSWYYDPLPTNCVADWICPGGTGAGYPEYSHSKGPEYGYKNLAVFFHACSFNCLFCQNWHYREKTFSQEYTTLNELLEALNDRVSCICFFGGDPTPQLPFAIEFSKKALEKRKEKILRICWETNGSMNRNLLKETMKLSLESGGIMKFDIKAWNENLHIALTGVSNKATLENFEFASSMLSIRKDPPPLVASTLLVPGYIDQKEIKNIASFIASISPEIPYTLLAFYPQFYMDDLPITSRKLAYECYEEAKSAGLKRVKIGNIHLLK